MKKLLLASAVAALSVTAAQAAPTVYGKAFLTLDYEKDGRAQLNSTSSRIGFKGESALTANTDLVYQLEYGVDVDADNNGKRQFYSRDTYIGLKHKQYGTLLAGRLSAIDGEVDYAGIADGGLASGVYASFDADHANNALAYVSPSYNGLSFLGMYVLDENNATDTFGRDVAGVAVKYEPKDASYKAGASYIQAGNDRKIARVSGAYDLSKVTTVGALYQIDDGVGAAKENVLTVSGSHKYAETPWTVYGQLDLVDNQGGVKDVDAQRLVAGGKYGFNPATTGHVYAVADKIKGSDTGFGIGGGIEYKF